MASSDDDALTSVSGHASTVVSSLSMLSGRASQVTPSLVKRGSSHVWNHFRRDVQEDKSVHAACNHCKKVYKFSGSTSNMNSHLVTAHNIVEASSSSATSSSTPAGASGQGTILSHFNQLSSTPYRPTSEHQKSKSANLVRFVVGAKMSPSVLDANYTTLLFRSLDPRYVLPTRQTFTSSLLPRAVEDLRLVLKADLAAAHSVSLTLDMWTRHGHPFMVITAHFIDGISTQLRSATLGLIPFEESHTAPNTLALIMKEMEPLELKVENIVAITTDTARNVKAVGSLMATLGSSWIPCICHVLNLIVKDAFTKSGFDEGLAKARTLVKKFRNKKEYMVALRKEQVADGRRVRKLIVDVDTRWNSTYLMVERLCAEKRCVKKALLTIGTLESDDLEEDEWKLLGELTEMLKAPFEATNIASGDSYPTAPLAIPVVLSVKKTIARVRFQIPEDPVDPDFTAKMIEALESSCDNRFAHILSNRILRHAAALHPKFQKHPEIGTEEVFAEIISAIEDLTKKAPPLPDVPLASLGPPPKKSLLSALSLDMEISTPNTSVAESELKVYQTQDWKEEDDLLEWWIARRGSFPSLFRYAMRLFSVQASEATSERAFSWAKDFFATDRASMHPLTLSRYLYFYFNDPELSKEREERKRRRDAQRKSIGEEENGSSSSEEEEIM